MGDINHNTVEKANGTLPI